jgi:hypothetical protein
MERFGGEPDAIGYEKRTGKYALNDFSEESPQDR